MAKFTKLNIGDSVASSGGRVWKKLSAESTEVQDELSGTWVFNQRLDYDDGIYDHTWLVDGNFYGIDDSRVIVEYPLKRIRLIGYADGNRRLQYYSNSAIVDDVAYCYNTNYLWLVSGDIAWESYLKIRYSGDTDTTELAVLDVADNDICRQIIITSKLSEVTNGDTLLTWLKANATKQ